MSTTYISINKQLFPDAEAKIHVSDLSIQRGFGIFDFLKTIDGKLIFIEDHLDRFFNSANEINLKLNFDRAELLHAVEDLMDKNNIPNSGIKFTLTGGFSEDGYTVVEPNLIITQAPFHYNPFIFDKGISIITYNHQRQLPSIKTIDYLQAIRLQPLVKQNNANDVLYHNDGLIRECPRANFFIVKDKKIITPKTEILKGITRAKVLLSKIEGYTLVEEDFTLADLAEADEAFITSSTKAILPVLMIDGKQVGNGKPGRITAEINTQYTALLHPILV